jgi:hypothetical protein
MIKTCLTLLLAAAAIRAQEPAAPVLAYPGDMAKNITVSTSLKWKKTVGATGYHVQLSSESGFAAPLFEDSTLIDTLASVKKLADTTMYYWRVRARNATGFGVYSKTRSFTTNPPLGAGPTLVSPEDFSLGQSLSPTFKWNAFPGAKTYGVQVSLANNFSTIFFTDTSVADTTLKVTGLTKGTYYYWHVRANTSPVKTAWTKGSFTTLTDPPTAAAVLTAPADGAVDLPLAVELSWEGVERASDYVIQVSPHSDFPAPVIQDSASIASYLVEGLAANTIYFWHVKGRSASGEAAYSTSRTFKTGTGITGLRAPRGLRGFGSEAASLRVFAAGSDAAGAGRRVSGARNGLVASFTLADRMSVTLKAYGALGREKRVLARGILEAGSHRITGLADARAAGIWWIELQAGDSRAVRRVILP